MVKWQIQYDERKILRPEKRKWRNGEFNVMKGKKLRPEKENGVMAKWRRHFWKHFRKSHFIENKDRKRHFRWRQPHRDIFVVTHRFPNRRL